MICWYEINRISIFDTMINHAFLIWVIFLILSDALGNSPF
jgi:hypothetical protein